MLEIIGFIAVLGLVYHWLTAKATKPVDDALSQANTQAFINILETANKDPDSVAAHALRELLTEKDKTS